MFIHNIVRTFPGLRNVYPKNKIEAGCLGGRAILCRYFTPIKSYNNRLTQIVIFLNKK